ncbi:MAG: AMP-binding protein [Pseudomonadales bacterium]
MSGVLTTSYCRGEDLPEVLELTVGDALRAAVAETPDRPMLITGAADPMDRRVRTYKELYEESHQAALVLASRYAPGERIAIWAPNVPEWVVAQFACADAGLIVVTVNPSLQAKELQYILQQSGAVGLLVLPEYRGNLMLETAQSVKAECPALREIIRFDQWQEFLQSPVDPGQTLPEVKPGEAVMIQYTSGTTGFPKGALLHHRGIVNNAAQTARLNGNKEGGVTVSMTPLFHTSGCVLSVLGAVAFRGTLVLMESFDPGLALELNETYRGQSVGGVPTMLIAMLEHPSFKERDLSSISSVGSGGSTVPAELVRTLESTLEASFTIVFGQTECSPVATMTRGTDSIEDKANTVGRPLPNVEVKIIDVESGETLPIGVAGEFCTRGYHVMLEYFDMPEATAAAIDDEGWLHSGDLCKMDARGYCTVEGRLKDMIIRGGENIYPREIEELLFEHPKIADIAVVGLPDNRYGEVVGAFIRDADPSSPASDTELHQYCREHLSAQKTPTVWQRVEQFPLTGSGKIQKFALREQWVSSQET